MPVFIFKARLLVILAISLLLTLPLQAKSAFQAAERLKGNEPTYPAELRMRGIEGWVKLSYRISPEGRVENILIEDSSGETGFEHSAIAAVQQWRFQPARYRNELIEQNELQVLFNFSGSSVRKVTDFFSLKPKRIHALLDNRRQRKAGQILASVDMRAIKSARIQAEYHYLWGYYYQLQGDIDSSLSYYRKALVNEGNYLRDNWRLNALKATIQCDGAGWLYY